VVGEPQRAFGSAMQVQLILRQLADAGASLWCPEVGGPVDPEAHDIVLNLFGGLSKAERRRLQTRVKAAKEQQASTGRFQGSRPPYGYRLVSTGIPHPNPKKAHWGAELQRLEPDPETAPWVQRILAWRIAGDGYGTIASRLDELGVLCPSAHDRERNPHRSGRAWGLTTVAAIVQNPRYRGDDVYGRYRKVERLYDRRDPSAGFVTKLVPADEATWVLVEGSVPALVTAEEWAAAQPLPQPGPKGRPPTGPAVALRPSRARRVQPVRPRRARQYGRPSVRQVDGALPLCLPHQLSGRRSTSPFAGRCRTTHPPGAGRLAGPDSSIQTISRRLSTPSCEPIDPRTTTRRR
jgi:site-specific DNA recombinase